MESRIGKTVWGAQAQTDVKDPSTSGIFFSLETWSGMTERSDWMRSRLDDGSFFQDLFGLNV